jgi:hypothetical protein
MSNPATLKRLVAMMKNRVAEVMEFQPEGEVPELGDFEAWGKNYAKVKVCRSGLVQRLI